MDYDYKYSLKRNREGGAKKIRLVLIFTAVAAVTALIIWKLVPASEQKKITPSAEKISSEKGSEKQESSSGSSVRSGNSGSVQTGSIPAAAEEENEKAAVSESGTGTKETSAPKTAPETASKEPDVQEILTKGQVSPGDLPAELDKPQIPAEQKQKQAETEKKLLEIEQLFAQKKYPDASSGAAELLSELTYGSVPYRKALGLMTGANWERFLSGDATGGFSLRHTVSPGEYLGRLTRKYKTTVQAAVLANKLKSTNIRIGQKLCFLPGDWKITVSKKHRLLHLYRNGNVFMGFDIGIGRQGKTPSADFVISTRLKNPEYRTPDGRVFKHGEPGNELGDFFLKLAPAGTPGRPLAGYGIHGTPDESSVTRSLSNGCIRMRNRDVKQLYYIVPAGTPVEIRE